MHSCFLCEVLWPEMNRHSGCSSLSATLAGCSKIFLCISWSTGSSVQQFLWNLLQNAKKKIKYRVTKPPANATTPSLTCDLYLLKEGACHKTEETFHARLHLFSDILYVSVLVRRGRRHAEHFGRGSVPPGGAVSWFGTPLPSHGQDGAIKQPQQLQRDLLLPTAGRR